MKGIISQINSQPKEGQSESEKQISDLEPVSANLKSEYAEIEVQERSIFLGLYIFIGGTRGKKHILTLYGITEEEEKLLHCNFEDSGMHSIQFLLYVICSLIKFLNQA